MTLLPVDEFGQVSPDDVRTAIGDRTVLVSVMWANNEVGTINPVREIATICHERGVTFHCDAVQAAGTLPIELEGSGIDLLSLSAHKMYGPKGVGALYVRRGSPRIQLKPQIDGGGHERHLRSGTLPVPLIVGFGAACDIAVAERDAERIRLQSLRDRLEAGLAEKIEGLHVHGHRTQRLANNLNVGFDSVDGEALMTRLTKIAVSSGSACTTANPEPSHVPQGDGGPRPGPRGRASALVSAGLRPRKKSIWRSNTSSKPFPGCGVSRPTHRIGNFQLYPQARHPMAFTVVSPVMILLVIVAIVVVVKLVGGATRISRGHVMLDCPQCGKETPSNEPHCRPLRNRTAVN